VPVALRLHLARGALEMQWREAAVFLPFRLLRERCPCAACRQQRREGSMPPADGVSVAAVEAYGVNALHFTFSDGHDRGIFPFSYLRLLAAEAGALE